MTKIQNLCALYIIFYTIEINVRGGESSYRPEEADSTSDESAELSTFACSSTAKFLNSSQVCDGKTDCEDGSDELDCEKGVILYYWLYKAGVSYVQSYTDRSNELFYVRSRTCLLYDHLNLLNSYERAHCLLRGREFLDLVGLDLGTNKEYYESALTNSVQGSFNDSWKYNFSPAKYIRMMTRGLGVDIFYTVNATGGSKNYVKRGGRNGFSDTAVLTANQDNFTYPIHDWLTSTVYVIVNSEIKFCDENITTCFSFIRSKFAKNPFALTASIKHRYSLDTKNSLIITLKKDLKLPKGLTVDAVKERIHWLEQEDADLVIHSTSFAGSETKITRAVKGPLIKDINSFAVFNNTVYWSDRTNLKLWKCSLNNNCTQMSLRGQVPTRDVVMALHKFEMGPLVIDHSLRFVNMTMKGACRKTAVCSHMCYSYSETAFDCYCEDVDESVGLPKADRPITFCDDKTLIVTYRNLLFVVGLLSMPKPSIIRRYTLNIANISSVVYDSIQERVILTEVGRQNIYSWTPKTSELKLILSDGPGTISSVKFDDTTNNLYWIDPTISTLKVMNMKSLLKVNLIAGNSSYLLSDFTLLTSRGAMVLLFVKDNSSTVIEHFSMHGALNSRETLFEDLEAGDVNHLSIHYMNSIYQNRQLYMLDKQTNELKFFTSGGLRAVEMPGGVALGKIHMIAFVDNTLIWTSEEDRIIRRAKINVDLMQGNYAGFNYQHSTQTLLQNITQSIQLEDLRINENGPGILRIAPVAKSYRMSFYTGTILGQASSKCLQDNDGCEELCLRMDSVKNPDEDTICMCTEGKELVNRTSCVKSSKHEKTTQQSEQNPVTASAVARKLTKTKSGKYKNGKSDGARTNFIFPIILGIFVGFALGYFREDLLLKFHSARLRLSNSYPRVRLSRINAESTMSRTSLCSKE